MHQMRRINAAKPRIVLLGSMTALQLVWLGASWLTGAVAYSGKIPALVIYTIVVGLVVIVLPEGLDLRNTRLGARFAVGPWLALLVLCLLVLTVGLIYAQSQRPWAAERRGFTAAEFIVKNGLIPFLESYTDFRWLGPQHPPLIVLLYAVAMHLFGVEMLVMRLTGLVLSIGLLLVTYLLGCELYSRRVGLLAAFLVPTFPLFFRLGPAAMTDIPVTFFFVLSLLLVARLRSNPTYPLAVAAGLAVGLGLLSKYTMVLIYPVLLAWFVASKRLRHLKRYLVVMILTSLALFSLWIVFAFFGGILGAQTDTLVPYLGIVVLTEWGKRFLAESLLTRLPSALGVYNIPLIILGAVQILRHRVRSDLYVVLWIAVVFISLTATLPAHRYYMLAFPAIALLMVRGLARVPAATNQAVLLAWLHCLGALYLFADWERVSHLFVR